MNLCDIPGCTFVGYIQANNVNGGRPVPLFEPTAPTDRPSINTLEGWNAMVDASNRRYFRKRHGRDPVDDDELNAWSATLI